MPFLRTTKTIHADARMVSLLGFLTFCLISSLADSLCFTPAGNISNDMPCNPTASASVCCTAGFLCMSNGLCQPPQWWSQESDQFIRGTCTDKTWMAPACRGFCVSENPTGGEWVMRCDNASSTDPSWCCSAQDCCSNPSAARLQIGVASVTATAKVQLTSNTGSTGTTSSSTAAPTTTATSATTAGDTTSAPAAVSNNPQSSSSNNSSSNNGIKIGLGVGLGVGIPVLILISAGFFFLGRRRRQIDHDHDQLNAAGPVYDGSYYPQGQKEGGGAKTPVYGGGLVHIPPSELQSEYDGRYQNHSEGRPVELQGD